MISPLDFKHDPGLIQFLNTQCELSDNIHDPDAYCGMYEVNDGEESFINDVAYNDSETVVTRFKPRQSGGTTLMCAMIWYYHLIGKRVLVTIASDRYRMHMIDSLLSVRVSGCAYNDTKNTYYCIELYCTQYPSIWSPQHVVDVLMYDNRGHIADVRGMQHYDYVFVDNAKLYQVDGMKDYILPVVNQKLVLNIAP